MSIKLAADAAWATLIAIIVSLAARTRRFDWVRVAFEMGRRAEQISRQRADLNATTVQFRRLMDAKTVKLKRR